MVGERVYVLLIQLFEDEWYLLIYPK